MSKILLIVLSFTPGIIFPKGIPKDSVEKSLHIEHADPVFFDFTTNLTPKKRENNLNSNLSFSDYITKYSALLSQLEIEFPLNMLFLIAAKNWNDKYFFLLASGTEITQILDSSQLTYTNYMTPLVTNALARKSIFGELNVTIN